MGKITDVACLVLMDSNSCLLATQRPPHKQLGNLWEFPGGKVEPGESPEQALRREIQEELSLQLGSLTPLTPSVTNYSFGTIRLLPFLSLCSSRPSFTLHEHSNATWIPLSQYHSLSWAPADLPILLSLPPQP